MTSSTTPNSTSVHREIVPDQYDYISARCAKPGDTDLDFDFEGLIVLSALSLGEEILIELVGGFVRTPPRDRGSALRNTTVMWNTRGQLDADEVSVHVGVLDRWRTDLASIRFCAAEGRITTISSETECLALF